VTRWPDAVSASSGRTTREGAPPLTFACAGIAADFSKQRIDAQALAHLVALARDRGVPAAIERLFAGERVNVTENRPALHMALRGDEHVSVDGHDVLPEVQRNRERMRVVAQAVREGHWKGHTGEAIRHVLALGIGGSALGPKLVLEALRAEHDGPGGPLRRECRRGRVRRRRRRHRSRLHAGRVASKTFTTQETMVNAGGRAALVVASLGEQALARHVDRRDRQQRGRRRMGPARVQRVPVLRVGRRALLVWSSVGSASPSGSACRASSNSSPARTLPISRSAPRRSSATCRHVAALVGIWNRNILGAPDARGPLVRLAPREPACVPAAAGDGIQRQARRQRRQPARDPELPRRLGRHGHTRPARLPPMAAPGHRRRRL
jgi:glucose-6-phosphate isomerase